MAAGKNMGLLRWLCRRTCLSRNLCWHLGFSRSAGHLRGAYGMPSTQMPGSCASRSYTQLKKLSEQDPDAFWGSLAKDGLLWSKPFEQVRNCDFTTGKINWFVGGELNVTVEVARKHCDFKILLTASIAAEVSSLRNTSTAMLDEEHMQLLESTCRLANTLRRHGVKKGDRVAIYIPVSPLAVIAMLACARIGAVHTVVFAGFSAEALAGRIQDAKCKAVITCNQGLRGGKIIELKKTVDEAVLTCPTVKYVFVGNRTENKVPMGKIDIQLEDEMAKESPVCPPEALGSEDMLFMLYTSGSTGKPKGIVHTQAGYLLFAATTHKHVFDYNQGDVFGCVADIGWITGHSYVVYGPLCNGATTVLFESTPVYPDPVGEPINNEAWEWYYNVVGEGRCKLVDTWWQTGYYFTGDGAYRSNEGYYQITGRMDDVINISGHRLGTAEIEDALDEHPDVPETAVIGFPHDIKGEAAFAFIVLKDNIKHTEQEIIEELKRTVASKIAKYAVPDHILIVKRLPKTRSGKIMRRVLRKIATNDITGFGDTTTLDDPGVITEIVEALEKYKNNSCTGV
ncbi:ACS2L synthetase, partial [Polypterus senegalus]